MYRTAPPEPPRPDPLLILPGEGLRDIVVGRAVPGDVFDRFGTDAKVNRYSSGEIYAINYDYLDEDDYAPGREGNDARPCTFTFEYGLLDAIELGAYQSALYTPGGVKIRSKRSEVIDAFGLPSETVIEEKTEVLRYIRLGIQVTVSTDDDFGVTKIVVFRAQR